MAVRYRRAIHILGLPTIASLAVFVIDRKLSALEARYPALPVDDSTCSKALRTPNSPSTQHTPHVDIYAARVCFQELGVHCPPEKLKEKARMSKIRAFWAERWPLWFFAKGIMVWEGKIIGLLSGNGFHPGDIGNTPSKFQPVVDLAPVRTKVKQDQGRRTNSHQQGRKRELLHGAFVVERPPSDSGDGLLVSWKMPDGPRLFFESIARWGYPWRLMSGGRHELSASAPYLVPGEEDRGVVIDLRFSSAHDYEIVPGEGGLEKQKTIPKWTARLHRAYARVILDYAVSDLVRSLKMEGQIRKEQKRRK